MTRTDALERLAEAVRRTPTAAFLVQHELNVLDKTGNVVDLAEYRAWKAGDGPRTAA